METHCIDILQNADQTGWNRSVKALATVESDADSLGTGVVDARAVTRQRKHEAAVRRQRALELRSAGLPFEEIARELGVSRSGAFTIYRAGMRAALRPPSDACREREVAALEALEEKATAILSRTVDGDDTAKPLKAIEVLVRIAESRRKLLGVDRAQKVALTDVDGSAVPVAGMTSEEFLAALHAGLRRLRMRGDGEVEDVLPAPISVGEAPNCG